MSKNLFKLHKEVADTDILFAGYADPPCVSSCVTGNCITYPDGWASSAQDKIIGCKLDVGGNIIASSWDEIGGIIIVGKTKLSNVVEKSLYDLSFGLTSLCVDISYNSSSSSKPIVEICKDVIVNKFLCVIGNEGCNPAGSVIFPDAPNFTRKSIDYRAWRSLRHKGENVHTTFKQFFNRPKLSSSSIKKIFPHIDFSCNKVLEDFVTTSAENNKYGVLYRRSLNAKNSVKEITSLLNTLSYRKRKEFENSYINSKSLEHLYATILSYHH